MVSVSHFLAEPKPQMLLQVGWRAMS